MNRATAGLAVIALTIVQLLRQTGVHAWQTVWAEDGRVYGTDAVHGGAANTVFRAYNGYVQVLERLAALALRLAPASRYSTVLAVTAALVTSVLVVLVYVWTEGWIARPSLRVAVAAMALIGPGAYYEMTANLANLGWPLVIAAFWAIAARRTSRFDTVVRCVVVASAALTTTVALLLVPWALVFGVRRRRSRREWTVASVFGGALALQLLLDRAASSVPPVSSSSPGDIVEVYAVRVLGTLVWGERWLPELWTHLRWMLVVVAVVAVITVVAIAATRASFDRRVFAAGALLTSMLVFAIPVWFRGSAAMRITGGDLFVGAGRYIAVPVVLLFCGLAVIADGSGRQWLCRLLVAQALLVLLVSFRVHSERSPGPAWGNQVKAATAACNANGAQVDAEVPVSPPGAGWFFTIPCNRLR